MQIYYAMLGMIAMLLVNLSAQSWQFPEISDIPEKLLEKQQQFTEKTKQASLNAKKFFSYLKERKLKEVHGRVFNVFFPISDLDLTEEQKRLAEEVKLEIWQFIMKRPNAQKGLMFLATVPGLRWFKPANAMNSYYKLLRSPIPVVSKLAKEFRLVYLLHIYKSELGKSLSKYREQALPIEHPDIEEYTQTFRRETAAKFDRDSLLFDASDNQVKHKSGAFDYIIIGSGPAGAVVAYELRRKNKRVIVVERGSFSIPGAIDPVRIAEFKESANMRTSEDGGIVIRNGNAVGGGSTVNIDLAFAPTLPTVQAKFAQWRKNKHIAPDQYQEEQIAEAYKWVKNIVKTRELLEDEINENNKILWNGSKKLGWPPSLYDLNRFPHGASPYPVSDKVSAVDAMLLESLMAKDNPLYLLSNSEVENVIFENKTAVGVRVKKLPQWYDTGVIDNIHNLNLAPQQNFEIRAKNVILCAGSLGSATILLRSGVQESLPMVGKGAVIHPSMPIIGVFDHKIQAMTGVTASVYNDHFALQPGHGFILEAMSAGPEYVAIMLQGTGKNIAEAVAIYSKLGGFGVMLVDESSTENCVALDDNQKPKIVYKLTEEDKKRFRIGIKKGLEIIFAAGAKKVALPSAEIISPQITFFSDLKTALAAVDKLQFNITQTIVTSAHMQATNKMGNSPKSSVVDTDHKVWGYNGLYIVDSSVFPTSVGANPMQAIYTTAKIFVDKID